MDEFSLIDHYFKNAAISNQGVVYGIGDDAACLRVPANKDLLISTDTLVANVHFLSGWDPYDIAWKAVMVNISDIAAMGACPYWLTLALTLPDNNDFWLSRFAQGLHAALKQYKIALIGGDTTRGPLSVTLTIHGLAPIDKSIRRVGAKAGDTIWLSGNIGGAAQAVDLLTQLNKIPEADKIELMAKLLRPCPRVDLNGILQNYASAAIDVSDGLSGDLHHICQANNLGACLSLAALPIHPLVKKYQGEKAISFALKGGDDYELCFTSSPENTAKLKQALKRKKIVCYPIGVMENKQGLRAINNDGETIELQPQGYNHF